MHKNTLILILACVITLHSLDVNPDTVTRLFPPGVPSAIGPYTPVTIIGSTVFVSGQIAINPASGNIDVNDIQGQTHQVMRNLKAALAGANATFSDVSKTTVLLSDMVNFNAFNAVYASYFEKDKYPARACYSVKGLPKDALVQVQAVAFYKGSNKLTNDNLRNDVQ